MPSSQTKTAAQCRGAVLDALLEDHKRVQKIFKQAKKIEHDPDTQEYQQLVANACSELKVHAHLEEELLYPAAREKLEDGMVIDEAFVEHSCAKGLIAQLESMSADDPLYAAYFKVLGEYVEHHIQEEEKHFFPKLTRAGLDWERIADEMESRRTELMAEMPEDDASEIQALAPAPISRQGTSAARPR